MIINNPLPDLPVTSPNTINIVRTSDFVQHVRPPPPGVPLDQYTAVGSTRNDTVLSGLVIVHLAKPKRAKYLLVEHITTARLPASSRHLEDPSLWTYKGWGSREVNRTAPKSSHWRDVILHRNVMELSGTGQGILVEAGPQMFEYSFVVPSNLAASDRTRWGRAFHHVEARLVGAEETSTLSFARKSGSTSADRLIPLKSTSPLSDTQMPSQFQDSAREHELAKTTWLKGNMTASTETLLIPMWTADNSPLALDLEITKTLGGLGTISWGAHTDAFTVGGDMTIHCRLSNAHILTSVWAIRFHINQVVTLLPPDPKEEPTPHPPLVDRFLIYSKGKLPTSQEIRTSDGRRGTAEPLWDGEAVPGPEQYKDFDGLQVDEYIRLPDENKLRPTTCPGTVTPIRVAHELSINLFFSVWNEDANGQPLPKEGPGELRKAVLTYNVTLSSCTCTPENLALPPYAAEAERRSKMSTAWVHDNCACSRPLRPPPERLRRESNHSTQADKVI